MSKELKFSSKNQAIQYLADYINQRIIIAEKKEIGQGGAWILDNGEMIPVSKYNHSRAGTEIAQKKGLVDKSINIPLQQHELAAFGWISIHIDNAYGNTAIHFDKRNVSNKAKSRAFDWVLDQPENKKFDIDGNYLKKEQTLEYLT
jgi:hypothetical protein